MVQYWPAQWELIQKVQNTKRVEFKLSDYQSIKGDRNVLINPQTQQQVPIADLKFASKRENIRELIRTGAIKDDRWAFLWYN